MDLIMPGLKTVIPTSFTDTSIPKLRDDLVLPDAGALLLVDPMHSMSKWSSDTAVPANNDLLPNLVQSQALAALGSSNPADVQPNFVTAGYGATKGKSERTSKGGLHVIHSQDPVQNPDGAGGTAYATILIPLPVKNYLFTNMSHLYFHSLWFRTTRAFRTGQVVWHSAIATNTSASGRDMVRISSGQTATSINNYQSVGARDDATTVGAGSYGVRRAVVTGSGFRSTAPTSGAGILGYLFSVGNYGTVNGYQNAANGSASGVFYRSYLEDLTVSGRTYAQAEAADAAAFEAAFGPGGRYAGDTVPTDPATIP